jgi:hypothetical protein
MLLDRHTELEVESWLFDELDEPEAVGIDAFSGVFALSDIQMSSGHYWLTFAMRPVSTCKGCNMTLLKYI